MIPIHICMKVTFLVIIYISSFWSAVGPENNVLTFMFYFEFIICILGERLAEHLTFLLSSLATRQMIKPVELLTKH